MLKKSREIMYAESDDTKTFSMHNPPLTANNIDMLSPIAKLTQEAQNESNRYCEKNRRFGAIVIPKEIRRTLRIRMGDPSQITLTQDMVFCMSVESAAERCIGM